MKFQQLAFHVEVSNKLFLQKSDKQLLNYSNLISKLLLNINIYIYRTCRQLQATAALPFPSLFHVLEREWKISQNIYYLGAPKNLVFPHSIRNKTNLWKRQDYWKKCTQIRKGNLISLNYILSSLIFRMKTSIPFQVFLGLVFFYFTFSCWVDFLIFKMKGLFSNCSGWPAKAMQ